MPAEADIDDLMDRMRSLIEAAYRKGVAAGKKEAEDFRAQMLEALGVPRSMTTGEHPKRQPKPKKTTGVKPRAAKGAVGLILEAVFQDGSTLKELQAAVLERDDNVSTKSVYNELWRQTEKYEQRDGKWFRKSVERKDEIISAPATSSAPSLQAAQEVVAPVVRAVMPPVVPPQTTVAPIPTPVTAPVVVAPADVQSIAQPAPAPMPLGGSNVT